jgi:hypothetical protein
MTDEYFEDLLRRAKAEDRPDQAELLARVFATAEAAGLEADRHDGAEVIFLDLARGGAK